MGRFKLYYIVIVFHQHINTSTRDIYFTILVYGTHEVVLDNEVRFIDNVYTIF